MNITRVSFIDIQHINVSRIDIYLRQCGGTREAGVLI